MLMAVILGFTGQHSIAMTEQNLLHFGRFGM